MTNTFRRPSPESGFSLLELLVSVAILAVGLISIQALENRNIDASNYINDTSIAMMLANYRMEEEEMKGFFGDFNPPLKSFADLFPSFKVETTTDNDLSLPIELPFKLPGVLDTTVSWKFHGSKEKLVIIDYLPVSAGALQTTTVTPSTK